MRLGDTIVAVSSASGRSARGVVRLSGPACRDIHQELTGATWPGRGARAQRLSIDSMRLPCLALTYDSPASYTGEDMLELLVVGNPTLLNRMTDAMVALDGVRRAGPGEFTSRAYLNGRLTIDQAEGVALTIAAQNDAELAAAQRAIRGQSGAVYRAIADQIASSLALVEAGIDFSDQEEVSVISAAALRERLEDVRARLRGIAGEAVRRTDRAAPRVAIVGAPNAGKSTLFNALLGRRRSVESPHAGATRDVIVERAHFHDVAPGASEIELLDLAGLDRSISSQIDAAAQQAAQSAIENADALVYCDPSGRFELTLDATEAPVLRTQTMADLPASGQGTSDLAVCALDHWNLGALKRAIVDAVAGVARGAVNARHAAAVQAAIEAIDTCMLKLDVEPDPDGLANAELIAMDLREALDAAGSISGAESPDDVIGRIFATFCIGK